MNNQTKEILSRIEKAARSVGRDPSSVKLVAVSKAQKMERVEIFLENPPSYWALGESYFNELEEKQKHFGEASITANLVWHFIGRLQSRKIPDLCKRVDVLHSVSRIKELEILFDKFPEQKFFIQINTSGEDSKNGFLEEEFLQIISSTPGLLKRPECLGLMCMPTNIKDTDETPLRSEFQRIKKLRDEHLPGKLLNMGTSGDFEIAIEEGAEVIRLGSCLFGARDYK